MKKINLLAIFIALIFLGFMINSSCKKEETSAAAVNIVQSDGNTFVSEDGVTDTYSISLAAKPGADVQVNIQPDNQLTTSSAQFSFTPDNWNAAQTVTVAAVDDDIPEGDHTGTITHASISTDANYNAINIATVTVNIEDNDMSRIISGSRTGHFVVVDPITGQDVAESAPDLKFIGETSLGYMSQTAILVSANVGSDNYPVIFTCDPLTGGDVNQLLDDTEYYVMNIDGSPVEPRIVFSAKDEAEFKLHIYAINEDGSNLSRLSIDEEIVNVPDARVACKLVGADRPCWSPDGSIIAFVGYLREVEANHPHNAVITMTADGANKTVVYNMPNKEEAHYDDLCWSKDGQFIIFGVSEDGIDKVKALHVSSGTTTEIQDNMIVEGVHKESHWTSPIQNKVLFNLHSPGGSDLYTINFETSGSTFTVTSNPEKMTNGSDYGHAYQEADWQLWDGNKK